MIGEAQHWGAISLIILSLGDDEGIDCDEHLLYVSQDAYDWATGIGTGWW